MKDMVVAAVNMASVPGQTAENLRNVARWCELAVAQGAEIVCFPELCLCGYDTSQQVRAWADSIPGAATDETVRIARDLGVTILAGIAERDAQGDLYISHFVASPFGLSGVYRKVHLGPSERATFRAGESIPVFKHEKCRFGLQVCYDGHFPEMSTVQALNGADVIFVAHATPRETPQEKRDRFARYLGARAYDNTCYVVACNSVGSSRSGRPLAGVALALDPMGVVMAEAVGWDERMMVATLDSEDLARVRNSDMGWFLKDRRPDLYGSIADSLRILV